MNKLQKERRIKYILKDSKPTPKQLHRKKIDQDSSNYQSSSKTQKQIKIVNSDNEIKHHLEDEKR